jgi:hypothetical protein
VVEALLPDHVATVLYKPAEINDYFLFTFNSKTNKLIDLVLY